MAELRARMHDARDLGGALDLLEAWLARRLDGAPVPHDATAAACAALGRARGAASIEAVARACGRSPRRLRELFLREVGVPAKRLARVERFRAAVERLARAPRGALADVADASGYYDQAHMNRDFRALAGMTPGAYLRARDGVHAAGVLRA